MTRCTANTKCSSERPATQYNLPHLIFLNTSKESNCVIGTVSFTNNAYHNRILIAHMHMPSFFLLSCYRCACCRTSVSIYTHIISTSLHHLTLRLPSLIDFMILVKSGIYHLHWKDFYFE